MSIRDTYSPPDEQGHKHMYLARLVVGDGSSDLLPFDTTVDNMGLSEMFVAYHDAQAYQSISLPSAALSLLKKMGERQTERQRDRETDRQADTGVAIRSSSGIVSEVSRAAASSTSYLCLSVCLSHGLSVSVSRACCR